MGVNRRASLERKATRALWIRRTWRRTVMLTAAMLLSSVAVAQSDTVSRHSDASLIASAEVPVAMGHALSAGGRFSVTTVAASGNAVAITVSAAGLATSAVIIVSAEMARRLAIAAGTVIVVTAVATGWILSAAGESIAFVANAATQPFLHSSRLAL